MAKEKRRTRHRIEIFFDGDSADSLSEDVESIKNYYFLSWPSHQTGFAPDTQHMAAITFINYLIYERMDLAQDLAYPGTFKMPGKKTVQQLQRMFAPGKDMLKITGSLNRDSRLLKTGYTDTVVFERGKDYPVFHLEMVFAKDWKVKRMRTEKYS